MGQQEQHYQLDRLSRQVGLLAEYVGAPCISPDQRERQQASTWRPAQLSRPSKPLPEVPAKPLPEQPAGGRSILVPFYIGADVSRVGPSLFPFKFFFLTFPTLHQVYEEYDQGLNQQPALRMLEDAGTKWREGHRKEWNVNINIIKYVDKLALATNLPGMKAAALLRQQPGCTRGSFAKWLKEHGLTFLKQVRLAVLSYPLGDWLPPPPLSTFYPLPSAESIRSATTSAFQEDTGTTCRSPTCYEEETSWYTFNFIN